MRVEHSKHRVAEFGKLVVKFQPYAGGELSERLNQPLDVRVF